MTNSFGEFARARLFLVIGSNMTEAHPVAATFVKEAVRKGAQLIVVDPRRTGIAEHATVHLALRVGTDIALLNAIMHVLIEEDLYDREYVERCTEGFEELAQKVREYPPERAAEICSIDASTIRNVARLLASVKPAMLIYTLGITEHTCGVNNVLSCANLQMLLGNVGLECGGVNPLRGQNNVQGACDMGALPNVYPGYQRVDVPEIRKKFESFWSVPLPPNPGLTIPEMLDGLLEGKVRGFYVFGENLANTEPNIRHVERCLEAAEFLVCQDIFPTETTRFAHVVLPGAAWSETDGTFTNSERRVNRVRAVSRPPGLAMPSWLIFKELARRFGHDWSSNSAREIWDNEIRVLCPQFAGITYARLEQGGLQWPVPQEDHPGTVYLHKDGKFLRGRGRFHAVDWTPPAEIPDEEYPFVLSTGRRLYHYHTRTMTGRCWGLDELMPEETADISPEDAERLGIKDGELIKVRSRRGEVVIKARVTSQVPRGMVWMSFHFRSTDANWLTNPAFDPVTKTAEYKACAVRIEKLDSN
ncbi:formate dehydrogenase major subunit [Thermodesulforhabdus norvegica]|nr:formate dehydrogenase major subunit [Thermodesulforhabdus norvegica]